MSKNCWRKKNICNGGLSVFQSFLVVFIRVVKFTICSDMSCQAVKKRKILVGNECFGVLMLCFGSELDGTEILQYSVALLSKS